MKKYIVLPLLCAYAMACKGQTPAKAKYEFRGGHAAQTTTATSNVGTAFFEKNAVLDDKVDELYNGMSNQQRAAQMIMVASSETLGYPYATTVKPNVQADYAANILFLKGSKAEFKKQHSQLEKYIIAGLSPLFACDCEPTLLHNKFVGEKKMQPTRNLKTQEDVFHSVDTINTLMDEMGIKVNFAPIIDIAKNTSIISNRSFGNDPSVIISQAGAFIERTQNDGKAATIKHFPGHGAVVGDTHKQAVYINGKMTELETFEKVLAADHPVFVMVGHISIKNNPEGYNTENERPATTSRKIITDLLRNKIGFKGIITTDAMNMKASVLMKNPDWEAAKAGADLILMPADAKSLNTKIAKEIDIQSDLGGQFETSIKRIIRLKLILQKS